MRDLVRGYATARLDQLEAALLHEFEDADPQLVEEVLAEIDEVRTMVQHDEEASDDA